MHSESHSTDERSTAAECEVVWPAELPVLSVTLMTTLMMISVLLRVMMIMFDSVWSGSWPPGTTYHRWQETSHQQDQQCQLRQTLELTQNHNQHILISHTITGENKSSRNSGTWNILDCCVSWVCPSPASWMVFTSLGTEVLWGGWEHSDHTSVGDQHWLGLMSSHVSCSNV